MATAVRVGAEQGGKLTRTAQEALQSNLATVSEAAQQSTGQAIQLFGLSGSGTRELADQTLQNLRAVARSNGVLLSEAQDATWEWLGLSQKRLLKNLDGMNALMNCRTVQDLVAVQSSLIRDNLEQTLESSRRIANAPSRSPRRRPRPLRRRPQGSLRAPARQPECSEREI